MARRALALLALVLAATAQAAAPAEEAARLRAHLQDHPNDAKGWFRLGVVEAERKRYAEALEAFRKAKHLMPDRPEPLVNLAVIYNELGDARAAADELEAALALRPKDPFIYENLGDVYLKLAMQAFTQAQRLRPNARVRSLIKALAKMRRLRPGTRALAMHAPASQPSHPTVSHTPPSPTASAPASEKKAGRKQTVSAQPAAKTSPDWREEIRQAIEEWRTAWSARDLPGYFAMYAPGFHPARFPNHEAWRRYKTRVILGKRFIRVRISSLELARDEKGRVVARFVQDYRADDYRDRVRKEIVWERRNGRWLIVDERVR